MSQRGDQIRARIKTLNLTPDETKTFFSLLIGYNADAVSDCLDIIEEDRAREAESRRPLDDEDYREGPYHFGEMEPRTTGSNPPAVDR